MVEVPPYGLAATSSDLDEALSQFTGSFLCWLSYLKSSARSSFWLMKSRRTGEGSTPWSTYYSRAGSARLKTST